MTHRLFAPLACLVLAACAAPDGPMAPWTDEAEAPQRVTLAELSAHPGVYADRLISVAGGMTMHAGQACLEDRGHAIAIRLTPQEAEYYAGARDYQVVATGRFDQDLCGPAYDCPSLCSFGGFQELKNLTLQTPMIAEDES